MFVLEQLHPKLMKLLKLKEKVKNIEAVHELAATPEDKVRGGGRGDLNPKFDPIQPEPIESGSMRWRQKRALCIGGAARGAI